MYNDYSGLSPNFNNENNINIIYGVLTIGNQITARQTAAASIGAAITACYNTYAMGLCKRGGATV